MYVDKHGRYEIIPFSDSKVHRVTKRPDDPFPAGQLMGGKRYWKIADIKAWLARQDAEPAPTDTDCEATDHEPSVTALFSMYLSVP